MWWHAESRKELAAPLSEGARDSSEEVRGPRTPPPALLTRKSSSVLGVPPTTPEKAMKRL